MMGCKLAFWEYSSYMCLFLLAWLAFRPTLFSLLIPLAIMRFALMAGNWGQHALVDEMEPASDFRSSITLIDVASNRFSFNDGYHTSHHLNPLRHWREHPRAFLENKMTYSQEGALVFINIDYLGITYRLLKKDYAHLARCLVPLGGQMNLSMQAREEMLRSKTRPFREEEIKRKYGKNR